MRAPARPCVRLTLPLRGLALASPSGARRND